jgi:hypothetical protein
MPSTLLAPSFAACALLVSSSACGRTPRTIVEEEVVGDEDPALPIVSADASSRSPPSISRPSEVDAGSSDAGPRDGARCASKASNEDCRTCCRVTSDDEAACVQEARCESLPPPDDCRSKGCAEAERCALCWGRWVCLPGNSVC